MDTTFRIGRIAGIDIGVNWTWFAIFALIVWTLSQRIFPEREPWPGRYNTYIIMGAVAAVAFFFASLLAHELGHALQARRDGMEIDGITLWLLGGVAKFKGQFPSAGAEFRIASRRTARLVDPRRRLRADRDALAARRPLTQSCRGWGTSTCCCSCSTCCPRCRSTGAASFDRRSGTSSAATPRRHASPPGVGRLFGYGLIAGGIALLFLSGTFQGLWLGFIGWFLLQASGAEAQYAANTSNLDGLTFRDLMTRAPTTVSPDATLAQFMDGIAAAQRHTTYPVAVGATPVGLLISGTGS